ncbi:MAG: class I SAM-dependent methyltransferase [Bacteroidota bacterium]
MKIESLNKVEKFWDRTASSYDKEEKKDEKIYLQLIEKSKVYLKLTDFVLDFGCGTGLVSNEIANSARKIHAIDLSSKMIDIAKNKAEKREIFNIEYMHSTIFDSRLKKGTFDIILAFYVLHLVEDTQAVIQRINELLKPGGFIISATPCMGEKLLLSRIFSIFSKVGIVPRIKSFKLYDLEQSLTDANFTIVEDDKLVGTSNQYFTVAKKNKWI